ncbi:MAG TPA: DEAD/DEAH box helicase [Abditibacteriaceae bacterium]|jgi:ATP-dependent RNA helicase DeaD
MMPKNLKSADDAKPKAKAAKDTKKAAPKKNAAPAAPNRAARRAAEREAKEREAAEAARAQNPAAESATVEAAAPATTDDIAAVPEPETVEATPVKKPAKAKAPEAPVAEVETEAPIAGAEAPVVEEAPEPKAPKKRASKKEAPEATVEAAPEAPQNAVPEQIETAPVEVASDEGTGFDALGLAEPITRAIAALGFEAPTPIQARAIPFLVQGRDIVGQAQTGTGKTAAFALPIIQRLDVSRSVPQALVLAPTRELAVQVAGGIHDLAKHTGLRVVPVYGGQPIDRQFRALKQGAHIVVGTPGRLIDHLRRGSLVLEDISICVLDEADEMLALGFLDEVEEILGALPEERQLAFFSATMPPRMKGLINRFLRDPEMVSIDAKKRTVEAISQTYYDVPKGKKPEALARVLDMETPGPTIVFCHTRLETTELAENLRLRGYNAEALNGEMSQNDRDRVLRRFRDGGADLLVATDVAARGLDIETVTHVINYDLPWDAEQYIHRIGRTGRAGRTGDAITLVEARDRRKLQNIERLTGVRMKLMRIPTAADIAARRRERFKEALRETLQAGEFDGQVETVDELSEEFDVAEIAAAALQMLWGNSDSEPNEVADFAADHEQPESGMTRIFVGMGRQDGLRPGELVAIIARETGLAGKAIGAIDILDRSSFVEVPAREAENAIEALRRTRLRGKKAKVDIATPRR